jgi:receptor protein-tyrosine kinase
VDSTTNTAATLVNAVVDINANSSAPKVAQVAANAYATSFIAWRKQTQLGQINGALAALQTQMAAFKTAVAQQSSSYLLLAQSAQVLEIRKATATGDFSVVVPASLPTSPYAPRPLRSAILGLGVGLFVAIGLVFLIEQFDTRLRGQEEVAHILGCPIIGRIPRIRQSADGQPVVTLSDPDGPVAEAFRMLRGNLDFLGLDSDVHSLAVTSSQQGEGKSVAACNLAVAAALAGRRVILLEGDLRRPRIAEYLGLQNERGLATVANGTHNLVEALQRVDVKAPDEAHGGVPGDGVVGPPRLYVLTHGPKVPNPGEIVASHWFAELVEKYGHNADLVIVDTPALLAVGDAAAIAGAVDGLVFVVDPSRVKRPTLQAAAEQLHHLPTRLLGVVVLQHHGRSTSYSYGYGYGSGYYSSTSVNDSGKNGNGKSSRPRRRARSGSTS